MWVYGSVHIFRLHVVSYPIYLHLKNKQKYYLLPMNNIKLFQVFYISITKCEVMSFLTFVF